MVSTSTCLLQQSSGRVARSVKTILVLGEKTFNNKI